MKKNINYLFAAATLISQSLFSQTGQRNCGTMPHLDFLKSQDKMIEARMNAIESQTNDFIQNQAIMKTTAVVNIPVVVHVLYNNATQNISDAQIKSQIDVLNEDFRKLNADRVNVPSAFTGLATDAEITFCLASKTPAGAATTGIVRKSTTKTSFGSDDGVKYSSTGGDDAWNTSQYLNLWVCNLGSGLLGYAQFPGGAASTDGVVILYTAFGRVGTLSAPYNKGRTATHEVGHWLNLRHIWGDANCGSDLVNDTPTQQTSNYGCPTYPHKTCSNTTSGDMFMNYMDYVDDGCMNMFSGGQKTRMQALFAAGGARASLLSSTACGNTTTTTPTTTTTASSNTVIVGNGTGTTTTPYGTYYMDAKTQYIITKSELVAAGYTSKNNILKSLGFNVATLSSQVMNGFSIKIGHTTASSFASSSFISNSAMATVYSGNISAKSGWNAHNFITPFTYNGVDNLVIEVCFDNSAYTTDSKTYYTATTNYNTLYLRSDVSAGGVCGNTTGTRTFNRPNMKLAFSSSSAIILAANETELVSDNSSAMRTIPKPNANDFQIAPNPVSSKLSVIYALENENSTVSIKITNIMGEVVGEYSPTENGVGGQTFDISLNEQLNFSSLSSGVYFCNLNIDGTIQTKKFVLLK